MYKNNRAQISYDTFLKSLRAKTGVTLKEVSTGICSISLMHRAENGDRVPEKMMRDRMVSRLGVSCEKFGEYLFPEEYELWKSRQDILKAVEIKELQKAEKKLEQYNKIKPVNCVQEQFVEVIRFILLQLKNASIQEQLECVSHAIKFTVPNVGEALAGEHLLSCQELNLILEQMRLKTQSGISEYQKIFEYLDRIYMEDLEKVKIYPKAVYEMCSVLLKTKTNFEELRYGMNLCNKALDLLKKTSQWYYLAEIIECREEVLIRLGVLGQRREKCFLLEKNWGYIQNFCSLYYEEGCYNASKVIETRRKMLELSRAKLSEDVCTEKTIVRFEREGKEFSLFVMRDLFEKLGLYPDYRVARVISDDIDLLEVAEITAVNIEYLKIDEAERNLYRLENGLPMDIIQNQQEIKRLRVILDYRRNAIDNDEFCERMTEALECTIPFSALKKKGEKYLTRNEFACVCDLAFRTTGEVSDVCMEILGEYDLGNF